MGLTHISCSQKKNDQYRLCVDLLKTSNPSLCTDVYPLPTLENIFEKLNGGAVFCVLDLPEAYTQQVKPEYQKLLSIPVRVFFNLLALSMVLVVRLLYFRNLWTPYFKVLQIRELIMMIF